MVRESHLLLGFWILGDGQSSPLRHLCIQENKWKSSSSISKNVWSRIWKEGKTFFLLIFFFFGISKLSTLSSRSYVSKDCLCLDLLCFVDFCSFLISFTVFLDFVFIYKLLSLGVSCKRKVEEGKNVNVLDGAEDGIDWMGKWRIVGWLSVWS